MKNYYVTSLHKLSSHPKLYPIYEKLLEKSLKSVRKHLKGNYDIVILSKNFDNIQDIFYNHFVEVYNLWKKNYPCNILYCGPDCIFTKDCNFFDENKNKGFAIYNYTILKTMENANRVCLNFIDNMVHKYYRNVKSKSIIKKDNKYYLTDYFNCDVRYFPATMDENLLERSFKMFKEWRKDYRKFSHGDQIIYNLMLWGQNINVSDVLDGEVYQMISRNENQNNKFNGVNIKNAKIVHLHLSLFGNKNEIINYISKLE